MSGEQFAMFACEILSRAAKDRSIKKKKLRGYSITLAR